MCTRWREQPRGLPRISAAIQQPLRLQFFRTCATPRTLTATTDPDAIRCPRGDSKMGGESLTDKTFSQLLTLLTLISIVGLILVSMSVSWPRLDWDTLGTYLSNAAAVSQVALVLLTAVTLFVLWRQFLSEEARTERERTLDSRSVDVVAYREIYSLDKGKVDYIRLRVTYRGRDSIRLTMAECHDPKIILVSAPAANEVLGPGTSRQSATWIFRTQNGTTHTSGPLSFTWSWTDQTGLQHTRKEAFDL